MRVGPPIGALAIVAGLLASPADAFKLKTHVYTANIVMDDVVDGSVYLPGMVTMHRFQQNPGQTDDAALNLVCDAVEPELACRAPSGPEIPIENELLREAIFLFPEMVRGGVLGPDAFPDLVWGQQSTHVNHGRYDGGSETALRRAFGGPNDRDFYSGVPFLVMADVGMSTVELEPTFLRDPDDPYTWRAIDYAVYLMDKANAWHDDAPRGSEDYLRRLQAIAFAYGYLMHMSGDSQMHGILNRQVGSYFDMFHGYGLFGPLTEEVKHITAESLVDAHMNATLFVGPNATIDPLSNDPKTPGTNGVVEHGPIAAPVGLACPKAAAPRWSYCNPIDDAGHLTGTCADRAENPFADRACDPWKELCYTAADLAAAREAIRLDLEKCLQRTENACGDPAPCRLAPYSDALEDLPLACDRDAIAVRRDADGTIRERTNACIAANCAFDSRTCPQPGILGFADRQAVAPPCSTDPERFGADRAAFLSNTRIAAPTDFLYMTMIEDPKHEITDITSTIDPSTAAIDHVRKRAVGGPYLAGLLALRDELRGLADRSPEEGGLRGVSLDPSRLGATIEALGSRNTAAGRFVRGLGGGLQALHDALSTVRTVTTCILSFGIVCEAPMSPPLFTPSVILGRRAALIDEQLHRYLEMSTCLAQNVLDGTMSDEPVADGCEALPWYHEAHRLQKQARANLEAQFGAPPTTGPSFLRRCLGARDDRSEPPAIAGPVDHGSFSFTLEKIEAFLVDDTLREVLSLHADDLGIAVPELAQVIWIELNVLVSDYLSAPLSDLYSQAAGGLCNQVVAAALPDVQAVGYAIQNLESTFGSKTEELAVNIAFLREDSLRDPAWAAQVRAILESKSPPRGAQFDALLAAPETSGVETALDAQRLVEELLHDPTFAGMVGPEVRALRGYFGMDRTPNLDVMVDRAWPVFDTLQLSKLAAFSSEGIAALEARANAIPAAAIARDVPDTGPANLLYAARGGAPRDVGLPEDLASSSLVYRNRYDLWCNTVDDNLMCNSVPSLDDPDDYSHYMMPPGAPFALLGPSNERKGAPGALRDRSTLLDRIVTQPGIPYPLSFDLTNFAPAAPFETPSGPSTANVTRVFGNVFAPFYCPNPGPALHDRLDIDHDSIVEACDNCPGKYNPGQEDDNLDGIGNDCDPTADDPPIAPPPGPFSPPGSEHVGCTDGPDADGDGVGDACDKCAAGRDRDDADRDGIPDACDACPTVHSDSAADADGDGIPDACDNCADTNDPAAGDRDCDGVGDACDNCPTIANPAQDNVCDPSGCGCQSAGRGDATLVIAIAFIASRRRRRRPRSACR